MLSSVKALVFGVVTSALNVAGYVVGVLPTIISEVKAVVSNVSNATDSVTR